MKKLNAQDIIDALTEQRNQALDNLVISSAEIAVLKDRVRELEVLMKREKLVEDEPQSIIPMYQDGA